MTTLHVLFSAFDVFPSAKGAATRIGHTLSALREWADTVTLACLGAGDMPRFQEEDRLVIRRCLALHPNFLRRTEYFREFLFDIPGGLGHIPNVIHFRDIWSGIPLLEHPMMQKAKKIFEVNGVPSIELPMHYPRLYRHPALLREIQAMETRCLQQADRIITISQTTAAYLRSRGADADKLSVIPNSAESYPPNEEHEEVFQDRFLLYAGTLAPWQGITTLIDAYRLLPEELNLRLILACSTKKFLSPIRRQIKKLGLQNRVDIVIGLSRERLSTYYRRALFTVVPLTRCDRNELQGCCPLKIVESMAVGTPVIASDLAVCRELIDHDSDGWLVSPDSPRALAHAMLTLARAPELVADLGRKARQKIAVHFNQDTFAENLRQVYQSLEEKEGGYGDEYTHVP